MTKKVAIVIASSLFLLASSPSRANDLSQILQLITYGIELLPKNMFGIDWSSSEQKLRLKKEDCHLYALEGFPKEKYEEAYNDCMNGKTISTGSESKGDR